MLLTTQLFPEKKYSVEFERERPTVRKIPLTGYRSSQMLFKDRFRIRFEASQSSSLKAWPMEFTSLTATMGEINRGGHLDLDPKSRSGFFSLPDTSRLLGSRSPELLEKSQISRRVGIGHPDLLKFHPTFPNFPRLFPIFNLKMPGKIEENSGLGIPTRPKFRGGLGCPT